MARALTVLLHGAPVGTLSQDDSGRLGFSYDARWLALRDARPLSISLPLGAQPFDDRGARPFFAGLLPDAEARDRLARYLGVSPRNDFALLAEVGGECAGAVALLPPDAPSRERATRDARALDEHALAGLLRELPRRPLLAGGELRLSLAGAQDKIALAVRDGAFALPAGDEPTTHILESATPRFADTVSNEAFCMRLARRMGIDAAAVTVGRAEGMPFLLVERFDRHVDAEGRLRRVHQEDFCQALGIVPEQKYQAEGGPSLAACFGLLAHCARPAPERLELLRRVIFNALVGNADAHAKNFALLHASTGTRLAPAYDLVCTAVYEGLTERMAMEIGGKDRFEPIAPRHWERFAREVGLAAPRVRRDVLAMAEALPAEARALAGALVGAEASPVVDAILRCVEARAEHVRRSFATARP